MTRHLTALKGRMIECSITQDDIAKVLGRSRAYVTARMTCRATFSLRDAYAICALLQLPAECIAQYFPVTDCYQQAKKKAGART